jgi:hypothetical protein
MRGCFMLKKASGPVRNRLASARAAEVLSSNARAKTLQSASRCAGYQVRATHWRRAPPVGP